MVGEKSPFRQLTRKKANKRTTLVKSPVNNISNDAGRCQGLSVVLFVSWRHTPRRQWRALGVPVDDFVCPTRGSGSVFHRCGGVAHQTSLRSRSITMCYSNSPPMLGRRVAYSVDPVTASQDHVVTRASPHGLSPSAATARGGRTLHNQSDRAA